MPGFQIYLIFTVLLSMYVVYAGDEDCVEGSKYRKKKCFYCSTTDPDHPCSDPFNDTHETLATITCYNYCVKWVRNLKQGVVQVHRTCSDRLDIHQLTLAPVCMSESRPESGHLCFCTEDKCNTAVHVNKPWACLLGTLLFAYIL